MIKCSILQVPNNAAVQIYDYKSKHSRVVFGPDLVMLQPNEEFTQLSLSGGKPKKPNMIRSVALLLGPDRIIYRFFGLPQDEESFANSPLA